MKNLVGSVKDCFWIQGEWTKLGLDKDSFWFKPLEESSVVEDLRKLNYSLQISSGTPFCVGVLDPTKIQKSGVYAGASSSGNVIDVENETVDFSIATDTGGSTIAPSGRAHLYGFKPSYGRVSRYGLNPLCSELDVVSIITREASLLKKIFSVIDHPDKRDQRCLLENERQNSGLRGTIIIAQDLFSQESLKKLKDLHPTAELKSFNIPLEVIEGAYFYILCPDFYSNMAKFDGLNHKLNDLSLVLEYHSKKILENRDSLSAQIKSRILLGADLLFKKYDYSLIFKFKERLDSILGNDTWILPISSNGDLYSNDLKCTSYCIISNISKRPSVTIPNDIKEGYFITSPINTDYQLLDWICSN